MFLKIMLKIQAENNPAIHSAPPSSQQASITRKLSNTTQILLQHHQIYNANYPGDNPYFHQLHNFYNQHLIS